MQRLVKTRGTLAKHNRSS